MREVLRSLTREAATEDAIMSPIGSPILTSKSSCEGLLLDLSQANRRFTSGAVDLLIRDDLALTYDAYNTSAWTISSLETSLVKSADDSDSESESI